MNLGDSYTYPDVNLSVNEEFISFSIDLNIEDDLSPEDFSGMLTNIMQESEEFNQENQYNDYKLLTYNIETRTETILCVVKKIHIYKGKRV